ncbi:MAG TPA: hypothetical protein VJC16_01090 [Candidatus Nanoarchaeia archaeon]|nr:hypothetical protein [Candidatus Nanoarchaeia archaeon]
MASPRRTRRNSPKYIRPTTKGRCPYCHKPVQSVEHHVHDKHIQEKPVKG